jgi:hypothetical protein
MSRVRNYVALAGTVFALLENDDGTMSHEQAQLLILMDIRAELQKLNLRLSCEETLRIPRYLRRIAANTAKPRKPKA